MHLVIPSPRAANDAREAAPMLLKTKKVPARTLSRETTREGEVSDSGCLSEEEGGLPAAGGFKSPLAWLSAQSRTRQIVAFAAAVGILVLAISAAAYASYGGDAPQREVPIGHPAEHIHPHGKVVVGHPAEQSMVVPHQPLRTGSASAVPVGHPAEHIVPVMHPPEHIRVQQALDTSGSVDGDAGR